MGNRRKRKTPGKGPARAPGPVTNRSKANKPVKPAAGPKFVERARLRRVPVDDPGPEDVSAFDAEPPPDDDDDEDEPEDAGAYSRPPRAGEP